MLRRIDRNVPRHRAFGAEDGNAQEGDGGYRDGEQKIKESATRRRIALSQSARRRRIGRYRLGIGIAQECPPPGWRTLSYAMYDKVHARSR